MTNIIDQLIELKLAKNAFHAAGMLNVLQCANLPDDEARIARCRLYHEWKSAGENKAAARANAIEGKPAPEQLLQPHCGHPVASVMQAGEGTAWCADCEAEASKVKHKRKDYFNPRDVAILGGEPSL